MRNLFSIRRLGVVGVLATAALLSACGGDGDDDQPNVAQSVPASASQSSAGFIAYVQALVVASADTLEPADVSGVTTTATTDDTGEPVAVN